MLFAAKSEALWIEQRTDTFKKTTRTFNCLKSGHITAGARNVNKLLVEKSVGLVMQAAAPTEEVVVKTHDAWFAALLL